MGERFYFGLAATGLCMGVATSVVMIGVMLQSNEPLPSTLVTVPESMPPAPLDPRAMEPGLKFARRDASKNFVFWTNIPDADLPRLLRVAEDARGAMLKRLRVEEPWPDRLPFFLCRDAKELRAVGLLFGTDLNLGARSSGGYYAECPAIAVLDTAKRREVTVSHEVVHAVIGPLCPSCPAAINEGLAMLITERLLTDAHSSRSYWLAPYWKSWRNWRARRIRRARDNDEIPSLRALMRLSYWQFHGRKERLHYCLSWCLAEALVNGPKGGRLSTLLTACNWNRDGWLAMMEVHVPADIERRWREQIDRVAASAK